jgi:hypothetical protein
MHQFGAIACSHAACGPIQATFDGQHHPYGTRVVQGGGNLMGFVLARPTARHLIRAWLKRDRMQRRNQWCGTEVLTEVLARRRSQRSERGPQLIPGADL